ncbi:MAG: GNAT family N-acetyltransferase [Alteromonadaceae bacterium]|nr:MAG: GNAT family N-acetyltransferase [Alteromonadaceae bacterium]
MSVSYLYQSETIGVCGLSSRELSGNYPQWFNHPDVCRFNSHGAFPNTLEQCQDYVASLSGSRSTLVWAVYHLVDGVHIGNISLQGIDWLSRSAEIAFLFGETTYWGKGYAFDAAQLLIAHGFDHLNLRRVYCGTASGNQGMRRLAQKLGMQEEGCKREALYLQGGYQDIIEFGLLSSDL